ncbi:argonaute-2 isoform X1 [Paramuricea clavata]|uniref:Argonaute-2 isoform X1 n=1 Tax=Paramuricea clavata TaxID=317549 RepID=A0A6S7I8S6_PARCT|nr:argonaute-2 isoform X1 [Paramuricea clavata]
MVPSDISNIPASSLDAVNKPKTPPLESYEVSELTKTLEPLNIRSRPHLRTQPSKAATKSKASGQHPGPRSKPVKGFQPPTTTSTRPPRSEKAEPRPPRRPDKGGTLGRRIKLRVNFLPVSLPEIDIHHYRTEIIAKGYESGKGYTKREAPKIIKCMVEQYQNANPHGPKLVYDKNGENVYCKIPIPGIENSREYQVLFSTDNGKQREYTVKIKWVSKVSLYDLNEALKGNRTEIPYDAMQAVEVVLRHLPNMNSIPIGSSFYNHPDGREKELGFGVQVWNGTFLSIRPTQWKMMMLNVDTCSTVIYKAQPVLNFLCEYFGLERPPRYLSSEQIEDFNDEINDLKIETIHVKRKQRVAGLSTESAKKKIFDCDGKSVSVFEYFKERHNITLLYPDLPCLKLGNNGACIPMELCNIMEGQRKQGKLTKEQLQTMIKHTALPAPERQQLINNLVRSAKFDKDEFLADFGFKVSQDLPRLTGRVLKPPTIEYGQAEKELPRNGAWNMQHKSYKTVDLKEWAIVSFENQRFLNGVGLDKFVSSLVQAGRDKGFSIHPSPCYREFMHGSERIGRLFQDLSRRYPNLQLIIVILPGKGNLDAYYEAVKYFGDVFYGIRTQVIKANTASKKASDRQTMANICLKINAKLGGTTSILDKRERSEILGRPVIIFGADVTHPSPRDVNSPSIAAVVASMDSNTNLYSAEVRVQERRKEVITELKDIVKNLLKKFRAATRAQPEKIIFYRDGVGEGQFKDVLLQELRAIQLACYELHESFKPAITFIVVQKRHHTRFFAEETRDQCGKSKNIPPGTVVDTDVCHPYEFDWYLCSHAGIQGTSKPAHYHVLYDDSNFTSDQLQTLSNQLCHTYVRCARAVSIPAPAYYAHHVAFRARYHLGMLTRGRRGNALSLKEMSDAVNIHARMTNTMYFA